MDYFLTPIKNHYADFNGKMNRKDYWMYILFYIIIAGVLSVLEDYLGMRGEYGTAGPISGIFGLALFIPTLAAGVRRLHDIGKSGWWLLIGLIPIIGWIWIIVLLASDSK